MFSVPGNFGVLLYTIWQQCCENNSNNLGYMKYPNFSCYFVYIYRNEHKILQLHISWQLVYVGH